MVYLFVFWRFITRIKTRRAFARSWLQYKTYAAYAKHHSMYPSSISEHEASKIAYSL